jgi:transcriptional regulator
MYTPPYARHQQPEELHQLIRANGFATLITHANSQLQATHTPLLLNSDGSRLTGHIAKANTQWKAFQQNPEVLAIFQGPHTYISSSWYDHENVPTWNYLAVHAYGTVRMLTEEETLLSLKHLVDKYEAQSAHPVTVEGMSPDHVKKELKGLVAFEITITRLEASYKLSQNRDAKNYANIISELRKRGDAQSLAVADAMQQHANKSKAG